MQSNAKRKVVYADDSEIHHYILALLIKDYPDLQLSYAAKDGQELCDYLAQHNFFPDFCIVDLHMPRLDGIETIKYLRNYSPRTIIYGFTSTSIAYEHGLMAEAGAYKIYSKDKIRLILDEISTMQLPHCLNT